jgi:hypothetical protein
LTHHLSSTCTWTCTCKDSFTSFSLDSIFPSKMKYLPILLMLCIIAVVIFDVRYVSSVATMDLDRQQIPLDMESFRIRSGTFLRSSEHEESSPTVKVKATAKPQQANISPLQPRTTRPNTNTSKINNNNQKHQIAGLNCDKHGGPSQEIAAEMVYWRDIPSDSEFKSPYASYGPEKKYLTFEPDEGGWNNIRMSMETAVALAHAMGRTLVLPPEQNIYLLGREETKKSNRFTFHDFFHFDSIAEEHSGVEVITMEEFLEKEVMTGQFKDSSGVPMFPPDNRTEWDGHVRKSKEFWHWLRNASGAPKWDFDRCVVGLASKPGPDSGQIMKEYLEQASAVQPKNPMKYLDRPTPVDEAPPARLAEMKGHRKQVCHYDDHFQNSKVMHFMGDNASGARLLVHFYAYIFFEDWHQDLLTKRFMRDHLRYLDEIQCAAARVVNAVREKSLANGDASGVFDTFHIRRGDFQYKDTRVEADVIYENVKGYMEENSTVFIATDEKNTTFFDPLRKHYNLYFLHDFKHVIEGINKNYYGMLDQLVASKGRTFAGAYYSTFTGYITRMRGHHSQKQKLPGYERGQENSFFYIPNRQKFDLKHYHPLTAPLWAREFPVAWRDIDHDLEEGAIVS